MFRKYAKMVTPQMSVVGRQKLASTSPLYSFEKRLGMLYVETRAISARVNQNYDGFPSRELKTAHQTFVGRPVFVNHHNSDPSRTRGRVVSSQYQEQGTDRYIVLVIEVDATNFPKLTTEILNGNIDSVSMGTDVEKTICSYCQNVAFEPHEFCEHVVGMKGMVLPREEPDGTFCEQLVYEVCYGLNFFEISFVFDPADETAMVTNVIGPQMTVHAARPDPQDVDESKLEDVASAPAIVDTLREEKICPQCGSEYTDECEVCGYAEPLEGLGKPDLNMVQRRRDHEVTREREEFAPDGPSQKKRQTQERPPQQGQSPQGRGGPVVSRKRAELLSRRANTARTMLKSASTKEHWTPATGVGTLASVPTPRGYQTFVITPEDNGGVDLWRYSSVEPGMTGRRDHLGHFSSPEMASRVVSRKVANLTPTPQPKRNRVRRRATRQGGRIIQRRASLLEIQEWFEGERLTPQDLEYLDPLEVIASFEDSVGREITPEEEEWLGATIQQLLSYETQY